MVAIFTQNTINISQRNATTCVHPMLLAVCVCVSVILLFHCTSKSLQKWRNSNQTHERRPLSRTRTILLTLVLDTGTDHAQQVLARQHTARVRLMRIIANVVQRYQTVRERVVHILLYVLRLEIVQIWPLRHRMVAE